MSVLSSQTLYCGFAATRGCEGVAGAGGGGGGAAGGAAAGAGGGGGGVQFY